MRVCLCALTGFGNSALSGLRDSPQVRDILVFTRSERGAYPYFRVPTLKEQCRRSGVKAYMDWSFAARRTFEKIKKFKPELLIVSTFDQIVPEQIIRIPTLGAVNIHPSLLPKFRGTTPTSWAIITGAKTTGITYHWLTNKFDSGDILFQQELRMGRLTDGTLRKKLAMLVRKTAPLFIRKLSAGLLRPRPQDPKLVSIFPRITSDRAIKLLCQGHYKRERIIRALTPYPGRTFLKKLAADSSGEVIRDF